MNLYTKTMVWGSLYFVLVIALIITLKPIPGGSSSDFSSVSQLGADSEKNISDAELTGFLNVNNAIDSFREYLREQLQSIMNEHGMTKQRYNQIAAMENDPKAVSDAAEHERESAKIISQRITELQFEVQQQAFSVIKEHRLTVERFIEITELISKDSALRRRFDKLAEESRKHSRKTAREFRFRFCFKERNCSLRTAPLFCAVLASA
ncbi:MAG: DUF4168 domain-containing protein [Chitinispirillales bacterium]|jgi:hypothetical protein|nr:DUF4168 domain-containing protein [Chitinispirillales bacterium]